MEPKFAGRYVKYENRSLVDQIAHDTFDLLAQHATANKDMPNPFVVDPEKATPTPMPPSKSSGDVDDVANLITQVQEYDDNGNAVGNKRKSLIQKGFEVGKGVKHTDGSPHMGPYDFNHLKCLWENMKTSSHQI